MFEAVQNQRLNEITRLFRTGHVDPNCVNTCGVTGLGLAATLGHTQIVDLFIEVQKKPQNYFSFSQIIFWFSQELKLGINSSTASLE